MARKPKTNASASTVQLGLARALGDGSATKPEAFLVALDKLEGRIEKPDPTRYGKEEWNSLLQSIGERGLDQPVLATPGTETGTYTIVEGRHRALALETLRFTEVPCLLRADYSEADAALAEIVTNTQRSTTGNPLNEARALRRAMDAGGLTAEDVARKVGRSASWVHQRLRLLKLADVGPGGEQLASRLGATDGVGDIVTLEELQPAFQLLEIPTGIPNRDELIRDGLQAAAKSRRMDNYGIRDAIQKSLDQNGAVVIDYDFTGHEVSEDPAFKRAINKLPGFTLGRGNYRVVLDKKAAVEAREAALKRLSTKDRPLSKKGKTVDVKGMQLRAIGRIQADLVTRHAKAQVSYGADFYKTLVLQWLNNLGMIGSRNVDRALMKEAAGVEKWSGRGEDLVRHVEKAWDTAEAGRILQVALYLAKDRRQVYQQGSGVPDPFCALVMGKTNATVAAQAKREVAARLKQEKEDEKKAKKGGKAAKARATAPAEDPDGGEDPEAAYDDAAAREHGVEGSNEEPNEDDAGEE